MLAPCTTPCAPPEREPSEISFTSPLVRPRTTDCVIGEADPDAVLSELAGFQVELKDAKAKNLLRPHRRRV